MNTLGIDLSLNATGLAMLSVGEANPPVLPQWAGAPFCVQEGQGEVYQGVTVPSDGLGVLERWEAVLCAILAYAHHAHEIMIEGYAFSSNSAYSHATAEIGGIVRYHLRKLGFVPLEIPPTSLKKFLVGKGNAKKPEMLAAVYRRYGVKLYDDNMADAYGLAKMGQAMQVPAEYLDRVQREAIGAIKYPVQKLRKVRMPKLKLEQLAL